MQETFKNVAIFIVFLVVLLCWNALRGQLQPYFDFRYGHTVLLCLWSTCVVIIFHLLYYLLGKTREPIVYLSTIVTVVTVGALIHFGKLHLA